MAIPGVPRFAPESHFSLLWPVCPHGWKYHLHPANTGTDPTLLCQLGYLVLLSLRAPGQQVSPKLLPLLAVLAAHFSLPDDLQGPK